MRVIIIVVVVLSILISSCRNDKKEVLLNINIPESICAYLDGKDTVVADVKSENTLLIFYDESECIPCDYAGLISWSQFLQYSNKNPEKLAVKIIFSIKDRAGIMEFEDCSLIYDLDYPVFLDSLGAFRAANPLPAFEKKNVISILNASGDALATNVFLEKDETKDFAKKLMLLIE